MHSSRLWQLRRMKIKAYHSLFVAALILAAPSALAQDGGDSYDTDFIIYDLVKPDEVIIEGIYNETKDLNYTPASLEIISKYDIERISAVHPAEALNTVAGVNIHRGSGQEHLTAIRSPVLVGGAGAGSFLYLEDGVPLRAAGFGNVNALFEAGTEFAGKFEVLKGPGPVEYGSNAVHGLINVQPRKVGLSSGNFAKLTVSDDGFASALASISSLKLRASASIAHDNGFRADSGFDQQKFQLGYQDIYGAWSVDGLASFTNLNQETAGFIQGEDAFRDLDIALSNPNPEAFRDGKSYRGHLRFSRLHGANTLSLTPYLRRAELRFLRHFVPGQALEKNAHSSAGLKSSYYGKDFNIGADIEYTKGSVFEFQDNPNVFSFAQGLHYDYDVSAFVGALYGAREFELPAELTLEVGARAEFTAYRYDNQADTGTNGRFIRADDRNDDFLTFAPKVSLRRDMGAGQAYLRAARGTRAPQVTDLYSVQLNQVAGEAEIETLDSLEAGYKFTGRKLNYEIAAFVQQKDNFFFRNANGFNVTNGKTNHTGIELSGRYDLTDWLSFAGDFTLARHSYDFTLDEGSPANNITDGDRVDSAPDTLGTFRLIAWPVERLRAELEWRHVGSYFTNPGNTAEYDGHDIFVARASFDFLDDLRLSARVDNLFDRRYADRADFAFGNERFFPGRPRTVFVEVSTEF